MLLVLSNQTIPRSIIFFFIWRCPPINQSEAIERGPHPPIPGGLVDERKNHPGVETLLLLPTEHSSGWTILVADLARLPEPLEGKALVALHHFLVTVSPSCANSISLSLTPLPGAPDWNARIRNGLVLSGWFLSLSHSSTIKFQFCFVRS